MKLDPTWLLLAAGGALVGYGIYRALGSSGSEAASAPPLAPQPAADAGPDAAPERTYGEPQVTTPFPSGYRRLKQAEVTPALSSKASAIRSSSGFTSLQYGTVIPIEAGTAALVEQHYHEPLGPVKPWGYHHGVTLIRKA